MAEWVVERIIHFGPEDFIKDGFTHFGFHDRVGNHYAISHQKHFLGLMGNNYELVWTVATQQVFHEIPNIVAELCFPMYIDSFDDGKLVISNFKDAKLHLIDPSKKKAKLFIDGLKIGMKDAGNCVVDDEGLARALKRIHCVWELRVLRVVRGLFSGLAIKTVK